MSEGQILLSKMKEYQQTMMLLKDEMKNFLTKKEIPLQERWEVFKHLPKDCYEHDSYGPSFSNMGDLVMYDGFIHADRYQTVNVIDMVEKIENAKKDIENQNKMFKKDLKQVNVEVLKEEVMKDMIGSFKYDW